MQFLFLIEVEDRMGDEFYKSRKWLMCREKILKRDKYLCQECKRYHRHTADGLPITAEIVHHIKPYESHPELALEKENLISLCVSCHNKKHPERAHGWKEKRKPPRS